jgi:type I restriction enzyme S subunit
MNNSCSKLRLGEVLTERKEVPDADRLRNGETRIISKIRFDTGKIELREETKTKTDMILIRPGDLVISGINAAKGAIAIYEDSNLGPAAATIHYSSYSINREKAEPIYLWFFLRSQIFRNILISNLPGGIKTELKPTRLLSMTVLLPTVKEQKRAVGCIMHAISIIEQSKQLRSLAMSEADALMKVISSSLFEKLENSSQVALERLCNRITKGESPRWQGYSYLSEGPVFIRSENVLWGSIDLADAKRIPYGFHKKLSRSQLKGNDVLINLVGASIGRSAVVPVDIGDANVNQAVAVISPKEMLNPNYLMRFLISPLAQQVLQRGKVDSARPNISLDDLRHLAIPLPCPDKPQESLSIQSQIVSYLDTVQQRITDLKSVQNETEKNMDELHFSVLEKGLKGEL